MPVHPKEQKGFVELNSSSDPVNALMFMIRSALVGGINTAEVVKVKGVYPGGSGPTGRVDVVPLVCQVDPEGNTLPPAPLFSLPYFRVQGGVAALLVDPVPGDIGIAVFMKRDSTLVDVGQKEPVQPGSFRKFDVSDGFYLGGFLNQAPEIYLELSQDKVATLKAPVKVIIDTPESELTGNMLVNGNALILGNLAWAGSGSGHNGQPAQMTGGLTNTGGTIQSNGKVLDTHTHTDAEGRTTSGPN